MITVRMVSTKNNAKLGSLTTAFVTYITTSKPEYGKEEIDIVCKFLTTIPIDTAALFASQIGNLNTYSKEFEYFGILHSKLMKINNYKVKFCDRLQECKNKKDIEDKKKAEDKKETEDKKEAEEKTKPVKN